MKTKNVRFVGTCVSLGSYWLDRYDDSSKDISYKTFRKYVGGDIVREINENVGVPPISRDWAVSFSKGLWKGKKAVCMMHSAIHHIWLIEEE